MPVMMSSEVSYAKHTLCYPVYAADFDPYNRGYLVVAGGGGEGRSGVPNKITLLDVNNRAVIEEVAEIDLSREEDSVQSLANLATKDGLITFAGINSSQASQNAGKNEHFRSVEIHYPPRKRQKTEASESDGKAAIKQLGKSALFKASSAPKEETYQRLLRLSPVQRQDKPSRRIGAIASSLAKENEIIVFNATVAAPQQADILARIDLPAKQEAADLDIALTEENDFSLVYCDEYAIHEQSFRYDFDKKSVNKRPTGPRRVFHQDSDDNFSNQPKFRCIRFLNPQNVIALVNLPNKHGAELQIYHLYPTGPALQMVEKNLPSRIKQASSLDVCALDADKNGNQQFVIAVAGQDRSIEVYTVDYQASTETFSSFHGYLTLRDVHPQVITKVAWAPFQSPPRTTQADEKATTGANGEPVATNREHPGPQYVRLASTSIGNTVVIDTFPLTPREPKSADSRYVLSHPNDRYLWTAAYIVVISVVVAVTAFLFTSFTSGFSGDVGPFSFLPQNVKEFLDMPAGAAYNRKGYTKVTQVASATPGKASDLRAAISEHHASPEDAQATAVIVRDVLEGDGVEIHVHPDKDAYKEKDVNAKQWDELAEHEKTSWKEKLVKAGQWAESEGESVLKGVLWSTYAGMVGQAGQAIMREL